MPLGTEIGVAPAGVDDAGVAVVSFSAAAPGFGSVGAPAQAASSSALLSLVLLQQSH